jgi:hypothetical protein
MDAVWTIRQKLGSAKCAKQTKTYFLEDGVADC